MCFVRVLSDVCLVCGCVSFFFLCVVVYFFFFNQKTEYEMRISDWSSDVCSSDLAAVRDERDRRGDHQGRERALEAAVVLDGEICDACHLKSPWMPGDHPRWRQKEGPGAAVTERHARANPRSGG